MVSLAKLLRIRQGIGKKYNNILLEKFRFSISATQNSFVFWYPVGKAKISNSIIIHFHNLIPWVFF
jgi:hypothetical protein